MSNRSHRMWNVFRTLGLCLAVTALLGCPAENGAEEELGEPRTDVASEVPGGPEGPDVEESEEIVEEAAGSFTVTLTGDIAETFEGTAVCTVDHVTQELAVTMTPGRESPYRFSVVVPELVHTGKYAGTFEVIGADRSLGRADVAATRVEGQDVVKEPGMIIAFRGSYQGPAGEGEAEGEVRCNVPNGIEGEVSLDEEGAETYE